MKKKLLILSSAFALSDIKENLAADFQLVFAASHPDELLHWLLGKRNVADAALIDYTGPLPATLYAALREQDIPVAVIAASVEDGFGQMKQGATEMLVRRAESDDGTTFFYRMVVNLITETIKKYSADKNRSANLVQRELSGKVIAIGSSTGGTETVLSILKEIPADAPPILLVQHMPPVFTKLYAERADGLCAVRVWEARDGDALSNGVALIAPGGFHMVLTKNQGRLQVALNQTPPVHSQRPAADVLFQSVAEVVGPEAVGVILTGMGADGAQGLLAMRRRGAYTIGQDKETSIVYGMPRAAFEMGAVTVQLPLERIAREIMDRATG